MFSTGIAKLPDFLQDIRSCEILIFTGREQILQDRKNVAEYEIFDTVHFVDYTDSCSV